MKKISLSKRRFVIVDDEDFDLVSRCGWWISDTGYATNNRGGKIVRMHRLILNPKKGEYVDHINRNKLDNRRENLRTCTNGQNTMNQPKKSQNTSGFKGVTRHSATRWLAQIKVNYKNNYLGLFKFKRDAAKAYNEAALLHYGEFAYLNKI